jgi:hypothetical protein
MRKRAPNSYGFTTTPDEISLTRIAKEATPNTRFLLTSVKDVTTGHTSLVVFIRKDALPKKSEGITLLDMPLGRKKGGIPIEAFRAYTFAPEHPKKAANIIKSDLQRLKNHLLGRNLRVLVEAI